MATLEHVRIDEQLTAEEVHAAIQTRLNDLSPNLIEQLGIVSTHLQEVPVPGPHRLLVLDETAQPTDNFKTNGAAVVVHTRLERNPGATTFVTGTAGNFGAALANAAGHAGRKSILVAPDSLSPAKQSNMEHRGGRVRLVADDVIGAIATAQALAEEHSDWEFVHPFNDLDAIAGQALVGRRIAMGLRSLGVGGPTVVLIQRGGGSLLGGVASALHTPSESNRHVLEVRPERLEGNLLDPRYDGLAVEAPGSLVAALIADPAFVHGTVEVSESDTGRAGNRMAKFFGGRRFEPSGLAGVAAFEKLSVDTLTPTTFVAVLSGANVTQEAYADFADAPRREQMRLLTRIALESSLENPPTEGYGTKTWSSPVAGWH